MAQLASGGTDVVNGQIYGSGWAAMFYPGNAVGPTIRGVGGDMAAPTLPYLTASQTGGAPGQAGRVLSMSSILVLAAMFAVGALLAYHIHWS